jgi:hypothetical protein
MLDVDDPMELSLLNTMIKKKAFFDQCYIVDRKSSFISVEEAWFDN